MQILRQWCRAIVDRTLYFETSYTFWRTFASSLFPLEEEDLLYWTASKQKESTAWRKRKEINLTRDLIYEREIDVLQF